MWHYSCNLDPAVLGESRRSYARQKEHRCVKCESDMEIGYHWAQTRNVLKNSVCYDCQNQYCVICDEVDDVQLMGFCVHCKKDYCVECEPTTQSCSGCNMWTCTGCGESCDGCGKFWCKQCPNLFRCVCCNETVCAECSPYEESFMRAIPAEEFACVGCKDGDC